MTHLTSLVDADNGYHVLCVAVIARAVQDATAERLGRKPNRTLPTADERDEARAWLQSDALLPWLAPLVPPYMNVREVAERVRALAFETNERAA